MIKYKINLNKLISKDQNALSIVISRDGFNKDLRNCTLHADFSNTEKFCKMLEAALNEMSEGYWTMEEDQPKYIDDPL